MANTPLLQFMHDTVGKVNNIKILSEMLLRTELTPEQKEIVDRISISADKLNEELDSYYSQNKP